MCLGVSFGRFGAIRAVGQTVRRRIAITPPPLLPATLLTMRKKARTNIADPYPAIPPPFIAATFPRIAARYCNLIAPISPPTPPPSPSVRFPRISLACRRWISPLLKTETPPPVTDEWFPRITTCPTTDSSTEEHMPPPRFARLPTISVWPRGAVRRPDATRTTVNPRVGLARVASRRRIASLSETQVTDDGYRRPS